MAHDETGSGPPLILLHGIGMSHAVWDAVTPYLRATRRVIAFDIPGFGRTPGHAASTPLAGRDALTTPRRAVQA